MAEIMDCPPDSCSTVLVSHGNTRQNNCSKNACAPLQLLCFQNQQKYSIVQACRGCHANDPNFMVYCHVCGASFTKWDTLRKHAQRVHNTDNGEFIV